MAELDYLYQRYRKELECVEQAQCPHARRVHRELARLYAIRIDVQNHMISRTMTSIGRSAG
ncbi:MAG TPA: hypothetical protein VJM81_09480 [Rhizorhapis sp.]|uniref:hypothetical protein n=1 Tax=Rhizorhapis sp. TaxID=1968842 RepID=UPI002B461119|nr:hypothetical protein [Rhizorhapis sp.]HKR16075.1 hypothetical protein [Rhizorhapis sp.]HKX23492.1 hypothetical protein [Rhizorhapis sp.]